MKKYFVIILILAALISASVLFYKWKQREFLSLSEPKVETKQSIADYAKLHQLEGEIFVSKNAVSQETLETYFSYGMLYVIDQDSNLVNCNIEKLGGECYQDIQKELCEKFPIKTRVFSDKINGKMILDTLFAHSEPILKESSQKPHKFTIIYSWVKYSKACINPSSLQFIPCIKDNPDVRLISLNTDQIKEN